MDIQSLTSELTAESTEQLFTRLAFGQLLSPRLCREIYGDLNREELIAEIVAAEEIEEEMEEEQVGA